MERSVSNENSVPPQVENSPPEENDDYEENGSPIPVSAAELVNQRLEELSGKSSERRALLQKWDEVNLDDIWMLRALFVIFDSASFADLNTFEMTILEDHHREDSGFIRELASGYNNTSEMSLIKEYVVYSIDIRKRLLKKELIGNNLIYDGYQGLNLNNDVIAGQIEYVYSFGDMDVVGEFENTKFLAQIKVACAGLPNLEMMDESREKLYDVFPRGTHIRFCKLNMGFFELPAFVEFERFCQLEAPESSNPEPAAFQPHVPEVAPLSSRSELSSHSRQAAGADNMGTSSSASAENMHNWDLDQIFRGLNTSESSSRRFTVTVRCGENIIVKPNSYIRKLSRYSKSKETNEKGAQNEVNFERGLALFENDFDPLGGTADQYVATSQTVIQWIRQICRERNMDQMVQMLNELAARQIKDEEVVFLLYCNTIINMDGSAEFVIRRLSEILKDQKTN